MTLISFPTRRQVLFICGAHSHTAMMHAIANELVDCDRFFTPFYCDAGTTLDWLRRHGLLERFALGQDYREQCMSYLSKHGLSLDLGGARGNYDLVVTCSDLLVPSNVGNAALVGVQDGMLDPERLWWRVIKRMPWLELPRWAAGTAATGLSHAYERYCVASEGYRKDFIERGCDPTRVAVTGLPTFDAFASYVKPGHWMRGHVLAATSDGRETFRRDNRKRFIRWAVEIAAGRPLVFKFHPNERMDRAVAEVKRWAPGARCVTTGSGEQLAANCEELVTEWSSLAYVGLALGKPTHSYHDLERHKQMVPLQHGKAAVNIAAVCRDVIAVHRARRREVA